jgi:hypothetical protein
MIPCIIIPAERSSVFRQAKENTARLGLSAIAMARQSALLLLTVHGYQIPNTAVSNDFYRQALDLDLRGKREYTESILTAMGALIKGIFITTRCSCAYRMRHWNWQIGTVLTRRNYAM